MKRSLLYVGTATLALLALTAALFAVCVGHYVALERAVTQSGGTDVTCFALVYGGKLDAQSLEKAQNRLGSDIKLVRGGNGSVYGCLAADNPLECAACEIMARGVLGVDARVDRWVSGRAATGAAQSRQIPALRHDAGAALQAVTKRLLSGVDDSAVTQYQGMNSASARGRRYHAAARAGNDITYMLAEGYLPVDY